MGLMTLLLLALCPSRVSATIGVSGNVNASQLTDVRLRLDGNTQITVDKDWYLREILGGDYNLKIILKDGAQLMVDQDKSRTAAIDAKNLDVSGAGELYVTGLNMGVYLHGDLTVTGCYASFVARHDRDGSNYWGTAVEGEINEFLINNAIVEISGALLGIGNSFKKLKIIGDSTHLNAWAKYHCLQPNDFIMEGGEVNLTTSMGLPLNFFNGNITGGKLTISKSGTDGGSAMHFWDKLVASDCELNISSSREGIESPNGFATFTNAKVNINVGKSHRGIVLGGDLTIDGTSDFSVNASHEAILCGGTMSLKADRFYAKSRTDRVRAVWVDSLSIHMGEGVYEAYSDDMVPIFSNKKIKVDRPYTVNDIRDISKLRIYTTLTDGWYGGWVFQYKYPGENVYYNIT